MSTKGQVNVIVNLLTITLIIIVLLIKYTNSQHLSESLDPMFILVTNHVITAWDMLK